MKGMPVQTIILLCLMSVLLSGCFVDGGYWRDGRGHRRHGEGLTPAPLVLYADYYRCNRNGHYCRRRPVRHYHNG